MREREMESDRVRRPTEGPVLLPAPRRARLFLPFPTLCRCVLSFRAVVFSFLTLPFSPLALFSFFISLSPRSSCSSQQRPPFSPSYHESGSGKKGRHEAFQTALFASRKSPTTPRFVCGLPPLLKKRDGNALPPHPLVEVVCVCVCVWRSPSLPSLHMPPPPDSFLNPTRNGALVV